MKQWFHSKALLCSILTCLILLFAALLKVKGSPFSKTSDTPMPTKHALITEQPNDVLSVEMVSDDSLEESKESISEETASPTTTPVVAFTKSPVEPERTHDLSAMQHPTASFSPSLATASTSPTAATASAPSRPEKSPTTSKSPAAVPSVVPTLAPTVAPTKAPTAVVTLRPTKVPTLAPTIAPTKAPIAVVTLRPTKVPTLAPTTTPTKVPTLAPTVTPTIAPTKAPTSTPQKYKDGLYTGYGNGRSGKIAVSVRIRGGKIYRIEIVSHEDTPSIFSQATAVISPIIATQSTNVDAVSGATASSNGIKEAVKDAISKA